MTAGRRALSKVTYAPPKIVVEQWHFSYYSSSGFVVIVVSLFKRITALANEKLCRHNSVSQTCSIYQDQYHAVVVSQLIVRFPFFGFFRTQ